MVQGGISIGRRTDQHVIWNGTLTDKSYVDKKLSLHVIPHAADIGDSFVLQHDNGGKHIACLVENMLDTEIINLME